MVDIKDKFWLISIVAGILGVITIFTPAWTYLGGGGTSIVWLWNMYVNNGVVDFIEVDTPLFALGLVSTIIIAIGTWLLLFAGILTKVKNREIFLLYLIGGILPIVGSIVYSAGAAVEYPTFWLVYDVNVAIILAFFAGGLGIFVGVMGLMEQRK